MVINTNVFVKKVNKKENGVIKGDGGMIRRMGRGSILILMGMFFGKS